MIHPLAKAVFLDKDGTLVRDVPYNVDCAKIEFLPGALDGCRRLHDKGYRLIVATNQAGLAWGLFTHEQFAKVEQHIRSAFQEAGTSLTGFYFCPHHPAGKIANLARHCDCRKPRPGLLQQAAHELHLDLSRSWMIGDLLNDVEAARRAGCRAALFNSGGETEWLPGPFRSPHVQSDNWSNLVDMMLEFAAREQTNLAEVTV